MNGELAESDGSTRLHRLVAARGCLERALLSAKLQRELLAVVRRRVPASDVDDVVQSVLCDALAAERQPEAGDVPRWIMGIARHKIADHHRRARREEPREIVDASLSDPIEARQLLRAVLASSPTDGDKGRTFGWLLREGEGEKLKDIAREERLAPEVVRKRVSRLRGALRARWVLVAASLALFALVWARTAPLSTMSGELAARPEPVVDGPLRAPHERAVVTSPSATPHGVGQERSEPRALTRYRVASLRLPQALEQSAAANLVQAEAALARFERVGDALVITTPTRRLEGTLRRDAGGAVSALQLDDGRSFDLALGAPNGDTMVVRLRSGSYAGTELTIERVE